MESGYPNRDRSGMGSPRLVRVFDHMGDHPSMFVTIGGRPCSAIPAIS
ncbi:hypothetical protein BLLJ_1006 [Bifidobacterium longum subsp. longum JCM 1217]|nr:hypothetical protein I118_1153 [Bifidobacterium longum D2957]BAJ66673.1 hypothetical protein BLLJ_1006 [Bifidobacterium longum subsp. longum JCM 1217]